MAATTKATKKEAVPKTVKTEGAVATTAPAQKKTSAPAATSKATAVVTKNIVTAEELRIQGADGSDPKMAGIRLHGKEFVGTVISHKANKTVTVEWERRRLIPKYERYEKRYSRVYAHNPITINARTGDTVRIQETRPLSKTKNFVVVEVITRASVTEAAQ